MCCSWVSTYTSHSTSNILYASHTLNEYRFNVFRWQSSKMLFRKSVRNYMCVCVYVYNRFMNKTRETRSRLAPADRSGDFRLLYTFVRTRVARNILKLLQQPATSCIDASKTVREKTNGRIRRKRNTSEGYGKIVRLVERLFVDRLSRVLPEIITTPTCECP